MPNFGDDALETAIVSLWMVDVGDIVNEHDDLVEMTTDKASFTVPSPKTGTLVERRVDEDDEVRVGCILCILEI